MNVRKGRIERIETPPTMKQRILKVHLSSGRAVHVPREVLELLVDTGLDVKAEITFVEKGLLGRTAWLGTPDLLPLGVVLGAISASEAAKAGWKPPLMMSREIRHLGRGRVMVVGPPQAQDRSVIMALLAHPNVADEPMAYFGLARLPASPAQTLNLGELWMREPFAPFECDEEDWLFFTRLVEGAVVRSAIGGLFGGAP